VTLRGCTARRASTSRKWYDLRLLAQGANVATSMRALALWPCESSKIWRPSSTRYLRALFAAGAGGGNKRAKQHVIAVLKSEPMIEIRPRCCGRLLKTAPLQSTSYLRDSCQEWASKKRQLSPRFREAESEGTRGAQAWQRAGAPRASCLPEQRRCGRRWLGKCGAAR